MPELSVGLEAVALAGSCFGAGVACFMFVFRELNRCQSKPVDSINTAAQEGVLSPEDVRLWTDEAV